ncbi:MAG: MMPL family transporter [Deltaproteobacteria bacterium]|nr:MMPL family transporter [Deltaproteobacteria bacterium]
MAETNDNLIVHQEKAALYRLGQWLIDHRKMVAGLTYGFTALMLFYTVKIEMFTEFGDLLPYRHPFVQVHTKFANQFGGANNITIMVEVKNGTIFNVDTLSKIYKMTQVIDVLPGINHDQIDSIGHRSTRYLTMQGGSIATPPVMRRPPSSDRDVNEIRNIVHYSENIHGILVSLDDKAALIRANFFEGRVNYRQLFYDVNDKIIKPFQDDNTVLWVAGEPRLYGWIYHYTGEVWYIFGGCTAFMWILLYLYFHDWRGSLRPTLTGMISAIWGLGVVHMIGFPMDPLSLVIPFFVTARAVSHSVQMHERYYEEYHRHNWNKVQAIVAAFAELFEPTLSGIVTDALGMLVIVLVPVVILQRIAISASIWVAAIVLSELILNPIIYYYLKAPEKENVLGREEGPFQRLITWWSHVVVGPRARWVALGFWVGAFLLAATQVQHITIGDATTSTPLLQPDSPYNNAHMRIQKFFGGVEPLIIVIEGKEKGALKDPQSIEAMEAFQRYVDSDPEVGYSFSLADIVKSINMVFYDTQPRWGVIPEEIGRIANLFFFYFAGSPPSETSKYLDPSYTNAHVTFFCRNHQGDTVARIIERCREYVAKFPAAKIDFRLAGGLIGVTAAANEEILKNDILMNVLGFGTIWFVLLFTYRSFVAGIMMLIPLFLANGVINAYIGFNHLGINLQSLPVVTVGVGFGIDYGLYIVSRAIEEYRDHLDFEKAVQRGMQTAGKAVTFTAVSLSVATLAWAFSDIRFNSDMGLLLFLWMMISFMSTMSLLPALMVIMRPKFMTLLVKPAQAAKAEQAVATGTS